MIHGKFLAGIIVGSTVAVMMHTKKSTGKKMRKTSKIMKNMAHSAADWMK